MIKSWKVYSLKEVCDFQNGFAFKSKTFKEEGAPLIRIGNIQDFELDLSKIKYVDTSEYETDLTPFEVKNGDVLIAMSGATTGKVGINKSERTFLLNQRVGRFDPKDGLNKMFLFYYLNTKIKESLEISLGSAIPNLSTQQIKEFKIPVPPLEEQKQIVAILDKALSAIEQAKANVERNIQNAEELFKVRLKEIFLEESANCKIFDLEEVCNFQNGYAFKSKTFKKSGTPVIRIGNIQDFKLDFSNLKYIDESDYESNLEPFRVKQGDVLIAMSGATTGKVGIIQSEDSFLLNQRVGKFQPKNELDRRFLFYYLNSNAKENLDAALGSAVENLSTKQIKAFKIPVPDLERQKEIVSFLDELFTSTNKIQYLYEKKINYLNQLKNSLLQNAFEGKLTKEEGEKAVELAYE